VLTLVFQWTVVAAFAVFGALALLVAARDRRPPAEHAAAWRITGIAFGLHSINAGVQVAFGNWAYVAGSGTRVWEAYLRYSVLFNHSRTFALLAFAIALMVLSRRAVLPRQFTRLVLAAIVASTAVGALAGWMEGAFLPARHFVAVALWDVVELLVMLTALFVLMLSSRVDRLLWFALCVYAFSLALNVVWFVALSRWGMVGEWTPQPWHAQFYRFLLTLVMAGLATRRLMLWRQGKPVPGLLGPAPRELRMVHE
jgi:hypothetical protein